MARGSRHRCDAPHGGAIVRLFGAIVDAFSGIPRGSGYLACFSGACRQAECRWRGNSSGRLGWPDKTALKSRIGQRGCGCRTNQRRASLQSSLTAIRRSLDRERKGQSEISPWRKAKQAIPTRLRTHSLFLMLAQCASTVLVLICATFAIFLSESPWAT